MKRTITAKRFGSIELRIGNNDSTGKPAEPLTENPLVGTLETADHNIPLHKFQMALPVSGKFLTLQIMKYEHLEADEINVNVVF